MTGRTLFSHAAAAELREQQPPPEGEAAQGEWQIVGIVEASDRGPKRHVAVSRDGTQFALLIDIYGKWSIKAGPWSFATFERCAEHIVSGDARAITWPDAQLCLAAGYVALTCEAARRSKTDQEISAEASPNAASGSAEMDPPAAGMSGECASPLPAVSPPPPADTPRPDGRCPECGG